MTFKELEAWDKIFANSLDDWDLDEDSDDPIPAPFESGDDEWDTESKDAGGGEHITWELGYPDNLNDPKEVDVVLEPYE